MALIPGFYLNSVLAIGKRKSDSTIAWIGTGFLVVKKVDDEHYQPFLVTNKHVLRNEDTVVVRLKKRDSDDLQIADVVLIENGNRLYIEHPDPNIDIAVVLLVGSYFEKNGLLLSAFDIDNAAMSSGEYLEEGGGEGSFVYMLGFPMGLVDLETNTPICRSGCIARITPKEVDRTKNFLLDIQNFPGNSGSPVISKPEVVSIGDTKALGKSVLIGIIHSYKPYRESLINSQTGEVVEIRSENSGIANAHPVEYIREIIELILSGKE